MPLTIALDQGTTSSRTIVFDEGGKPLAVGQKEFQQHFPSAGLVEHDAKEIWDSQLATAVEALSQAKLRPKDIAAIGITNQRETTVLWDRKTGEPLHRAIVWQDRRTADVCTRLRQDGAEDMVRSRTGLVIDPYFSGTKLAWLLDKVEGRGRAPSGARSPSGRSTAGSSTSSRTARCTSQTPATPRARCSSTSRPRCGTTSCCASSACHAPCCPRCGTRAKCKARRRRRGSPASRSRALRVTSRRHSSDSFAPNPASRRTRTGRAASCCRTRARARPCRSTSS